MTQPNGNSPQRTTKAKAVTAAIGTTLTALTTALASVNIALSDNKLDGSDYGSLALALVTLLSSIYAVWRVPNQPISST